MRQQLFAPGKSLFRSGQIANGRAGIGQSQAKIRGIQLRQRRAVGDRFAEVGPKRDNRPATGVNTPTVVSSFQ